jgi:para-aminobenzoate synthetase
MARNESRILVVDNYDSFTYNLVHMIENIVGFRVAVVFNDDEIFLSNIRGKNMKAEYDLIVMSPGPGHPVTDIGCVGQYVLEYYLEDCCVADHTLPVLFGVCMGFEAIGAYLGIGIHRVIPRHGQVWPIHIDFTSDTPSIFTGLPAEISQVRYHSLALSHADLVANPDLLITAYAFDSPVEKAEDGLAVSGPRLSPSTPEWLQALSLSVYSPSEDFATHTTIIPMAFRHRTLPIHAVQFHPESVLSEGGERILENVCVLAGFPRVTVNSREIISIREKFPPVSSLTPLCRPSMDISDIFSELLLTDTCVWLDSPAGGWSFMASPKLEGKYDVFLETDCGLFNGKWTLHDLAESVGRELGVDRSTYTCPVAVPALFTCLGYEFGNGSSGACVIADRVIAVDNQTGEFFALHTIDDCDWVIDFRDKLRWIDIGGSGRERTSSDCVRKTESFCVSDSKTSYIDKIIACQSAIAAGESYELCLTTSIHSEGSVSSFDPFRVYRELRRWNSAPYCAYFAFSGMHVISASPERFLRVTPEGIAQMRPIKGTRPRGTSPSEDEIIKTDLATNNKDRAENLMIVDLVRNDLSRIPAINVHCPELMKVETFQPYHQLVSTVEGRIENTRPSVLVDAVLALFPAGSMTGAPKKRAMEILKSIEGRERGIGYSGALGYISPLTGTVDLSVVIRTIFMKQDTEGGSFVSLGCGGAILAVSDPTEEWKEMLLKARRNLGIIAKAIGCEALTLRIEGQGAIRIRPVGWKPQTFFTTMRYAGGAVWMWKRHVYRMGLSVGRAVEEDMKQCIWDALTEWAVEDTRGSVGISHGPFSSISTKEWERIHEGELQPKISGHLRLRVDYHFASAKFTCTVHPVPSTNPSKLVINQSEFMDSNDPWISQKILPSNYPVTGPTEDTLYLFQNELGEITETGIANVVFKRFEKWITPPLSSGVLPGTLRSMLIEDGAIEEGVIRKDEIGKDITQCFGINSIRGVFELQVIS